MQTSRTAVDHFTARAFMVALMLSVFSIGYNLIEGAVSTYIGAQDEMLALFGFGIDSFIEVISAVGIAHMVLRIQRHPLSQRPAFERTALRMTGTCFYSLAVGLVIGTLLSIVQRHHPDTTLWSTTIAIVSIAVMQVLVLLKTRVGKQLRSDAILADAHCTRVCVYMSAVLLLSSLLYYLTGVAYLDMIGALGIAYLAVREGRESFEKAQGKECGCTW
jgi:predicted Co/Zn/Cd cation transporter (cation efflux family)